MANRTVCQTPGAVFHTRVSNRLVECRVELPLELNLDEAAAKLLQDNIHNAMELVLARYFQHE